MSLTEYLREAGIVSPVAERRTRRHEFTGTLDTLERDCE